MDAVEYKKRFDKLYQLLSSAYLYFYIWKGLQNKKFEKTFKDNNSFWWATLNSLQQSWLTMLAKIYEDSRYSKNNKVISAQALIPFQADKIRANKARALINKNKEIINNISRLRDHELAHNNANHLLNPTVIQRNFPVKYKKSEKLLKDSGKLLSYLNPQEGHGYAFEPFADDCLHDSKNIMVKLKYFSAEQEKHFKKCRKGDINDYRFPPLKKKY